MPFNDSQEIGEVEVMKSQREEVEMLLINKAHELKLWDAFSKEKEIDYQIAKNIFHVRIINLENLYIRVTKEQNRYYVQVFDEDVLEEKIEIENMWGFDKKEISLKLNKKVKLFN